MYSANVLKPERGLEVCEDVKWIELVYNGAVAFDVVNSGCCNKGTVAWLDIVCFWAFAVSS
jgi:hypothetical protein